MKKILLKSALCLIAIPLALTSCNSTSDNGDFRISYLSNSTFQKVAESKGSSTEVYYIHLGASNNTGASVTISKSDFTLKTGGKDYAALYFPGEIHYSVEDGKSESYMDSHSDTTVIEKNVETGPSSVSTSSFYICFEVAGSDNYQITYKGNAISLY